MKKTKIIAILTAFVILTAMTGIAAADPADVTIVENPIINPLDGSTPATGTETTTTVTVTILDSDDGLRHISVITTDSNLQAKVTGGPGVGVDTGWVTTTRSADTVGDYTINAISGNGQNAQLEEIEVYTFTLHVRGTAAAEGAFVTVNDNSGGVYYADGHDSASCSRKVTIPEFATIAIPVIGILGLFLFFNHRKHKEK